MSLRLCQILLSLWWVLPIAAAETKLPGSVTVESVELATRSEGKRALLFVDLYRVRIYTPRGARLPATLHDPTVYLSSVGRLPDRSGRQDGSGCR